MSNVRCQMLDAKWQKKMSNVKSLKTNTRYRAYQFSLKVINLVKEFPQTKIFMIFTDQLLRAATSIGANLIEAKSSSSKKDFIRFYQIALKSCNETLYWLSLLKDGKLVSVAQIKPLIDEATEISKMVGASILTLKGRTSNI